MLVALLQRCKQKDSAFLALDTHAGIGCYDLAGEQALKTSEYKAGIGRLWAAIPRDGLLVHYKECVAALNPDGNLGRYPGSPMLVQQALRKQDRAVFCELHPEDVLTLRANLPKTKNISVHHRNGYEAMGAFLPPPERRALVLVDPPFEVTDEYAHMAIALRVALRKFPTGLYALWYPVKDRAAVWQLHQQVEDMGVKNALAVEFMTTRDESRLALNGSGVLLINPPYRLDEELAPALAELQDLLAPEGRHSIIRIEGN